MEYIENATIPHLMDFLKDLFQKTTHKKIDWQRETNSITFDTPQGNVRITKLEKERVKERFMGTKTIIDEYYRIAFRGDDQCVSSEEFLWEHREEMDEGNYMGIIYSNVMEQVFAVDDHPFIGTIFKDVSKI